MPSGPRRAQPGAEVGIGAGVQPEAGGHFGAATQHRLEDAVVERAGIAGVRARHHRAAAERQRAGGGRAAEQELAAVEAISHGRHPLIFVRVCRPRRPRLSEDQGGGQSAPAQASIRSMWRPGHSPDPDCCRRVTDHCRDSPPRSILLSEINRGNSMNRFVANRRAASFAAVSLLALASATPAFAQDSQTPAGPGRSGDRRHRDQARDEPPGRPLLDQRPDPAAHPALGRDHDRGSVAQRRRPHDPESRAGPEPGRGARRLRRPDRPRPAGREGAGRRLSRRIR